MRVLLTGSTGFVGTYLQRALPCLPCVESDGSVIDLQDTVSLKKFLLNNSFDFVIHLAAQSSVAESFKSPKETYQTNFFGTYNLLNILSEIDFTGTVLFVGSAESYGQVLDENLPVAEKFPLKPRSPYAVSKVAAEALCYQFSQTNEFDIISTRSFNHIGPGQSEQFVISCFAKQLIEIEAGLKSPELLVGDIEVTRDFTDVRDVVQAYHMLLQTGKNGEVYNVCSGKEYKIKDLLNIMIKELGIQVTVTIDEQKLRPSEQRRMVGKADKIKSHTGWEPKIPVETTIRDMLLHWRSKIQ